MRNLSNSSSASATEVKAARKLAYGRSAGAFETGKVETFNREKEGRTETGLVQDKTTEQR